MTQEIGTLSELNVKPGDVVECLYEPDFLYVGLHMEIGIDGYAHWEGGSFMPEFDHEYDRKYRIISRATPPVDLTNPHGTAFGLLDEVYGPGTQDALKAHGGPYQMFDINGKWSDWEPRWSQDIAYRVKPAPKVETVTLLGWGVSSKKWFFCPGSGKIDTHSITFDLIDGEPDVSSVRMVKL